MKNKKAGLVVDDRLPGRPIRMNRKNLTARHGFAEVLFLGDVHAGSPQFDRERFLRNLQYCLQNKVYVLLMGDLIEMATRNSVGSGVYEQTDIGQTQYEMMVEWLKPLADRHLILGIHNGNHEDRVYKETGVNISKGFARELGATYLGDACWSTFKVGDQIYTIYSLHGRTGARLDGTALLALERISASFFCDLCVMGHAHKAINSIVLMQKVVDHRVVEHKKHLLISGSYLRYDGGYGQTSGMPISKMGSPKVRFYADKHDIAISW